MQFGIILLSYKNILTGKFEVLFRSNDKVRSAGFEAIVVCLRSQSLSKQSIANNIVSFSN